MSIKHQWYVGEFDVIIIQDKIVIYRLSNEIKRIEVGNNGKNIRTIKAKC